MVEELPLLACLNVQANIVIAKQALHALSHSPPLMVLTSLPGLDWAVSLFLKDTLSLLAPSHPVILDHLSLQSALPYWVFKNILTLQSVKEVNWDGLEAALADCPPTYRVWASKFVSGHWAIGHMFAHWGQ